MVAMEMTCSVGPFSAADAGELRTAGKASDGQYFLAAFEHVGLRKTAVRQKPVGALVIATPKGVEHGRAGRGKGAGDRLRPHDSRASVLQRLLRRCVAGSGTDKAL